MTAAGARWGCHWGLEVPLYFAPKDFTGSPTLKRSNAFDIIGEECRADARGRRHCRYDRLLALRGDRPERGSMARPMMASRLPRPGRCRLAPMLSPTGRLKGDLTVFNWGDGSWWIMGSYYLRQWHMRWFLDDLEDGVSVRDISDAIVGFALAGPKSRELLESLATHDLVERSAAVHGLRGVRCGSHPRQGRAGCRLRASLAMRSTARRPSMPRSTALLKEAGRKFGAVGFRLQCA